MKIMVLGDVYSLHTRRWASHLARNNDVFMAYLPRTSPKDVAHLFGEKMPQRLRLVPLGSHHFVNLLRVPRYASMKTINLRMVHSLGLSQLKRALAEHKPDLLHAHYLPDYGWLASLTEFHPLVLSMWGQNILFAEPDGKNVLAREMFANADMVMCGDEQARARLVKYGCASEKTFIQAWGVDVQQYSPTARNEKLRDELIGSRENVLVTMVARHVKEWNVVTLVKAAPLVHDKEPNVRFLFIGNGPEEATLKKLTKNLGADGYIKFLESVKPDDIPGYLASTDIFVDTYHTDKAGGGIGVAAMEAMSSGCAMVVARRPGVERGVTDGVNGYIFKGGDHVDLANKIIKLAADRKLCHEFGKKGRELALQIGDWNKNMADVEEMYAKLIQFGQR